ncbi:hypothetical protein ACFLSY_10385, partial [Bacteroidota bacterium]
IEYILDDNNEWVEDYKVSYSYLEDKMVGYISYYFDENNWGKYWKIDYSFIGDNTSSKKVYKWDNETNSWELDYIEAYSYNNNDYLTEIDGKWGIIKIEYEEGHGNGKVFMNSPHELLRGDYVIKQGITDRPLRRN